MRPRELLRLATFALALPAEDPPALELAQVPIGLLQLVVHAIQVPRRLLNLLALLLERVGRGRRYFSCP